MESNQATQSEKLTQTNPTITKIIDGRTYLVTLHFASTGETFEQKYERLLRNWILEQCREESIISK